MQGRCGASGFHPSARSQPPATPPTPAAPSPSTSTSSSQKTAKECTAEWRADKAGMQARGVTEKAYVEQCRAGGAAPRPPLPNRSDNRTCARTRTQTGVARCAAYTGPARAKTRADNDCRAGPSTGAANASRKATQLWRLGSSRMRHQQKPDAHPIRLCGSICRPRSITSPEPGATGPRSAEPTCVKRKQSLEKIVLPKPKSTHNSALRCFRRTERRSPEVACRTADERCRMVVNEAARITA